MKTKTNLRLAWWGKMTSQRNPQFTCDEHKIWTMNIKIFNKGFIKTKNSRQKKLKMLLVLFNYSFYKKKNTIYMWSVIDHFLDQEGNKKNLSFSGIFKVCLRSNSWLQILRYLINKKKYISTLMIMQMTQYCWRLIVDSNNEP